jgi:hypothetical protein
MRERGEVGWQLNHGIEASLMASNGPPSKRNIPHHWNDEFYLVSKLYTQGLSHCAIWDGELVSKCIFPSSRMEHEDDNQVGRQCYLEIEEW